LLIKLGKYCRLRFNTKKKTSNSICFAWARCPLLIEDAKDSALSNKA